MHWRRIHVCVYVSFVFVHQHKVSLFARSYRSLDLDLDLELEWYNVRPGVLRSVHRRWICW